MATVVTVPAATDEILATWGQAVAYALNGAGIAAAVTVDDSPQMQVVGLTVPAGYLVAGAAYRLVAYGTASNSGATPRALTLRVRCGPTTLTGNIAGSRAPNITATAAGEGFMVEFLFTVRTAGASGTCIANGVTVGGASEPLNTSSFVSNETSTVAVDTTVDNILELTAVTAHSEGTAVFTVANIARVA